MENTKPILNLLGLATKAGKTASGELSTEKAIKCGKAHVAIIAADASAGTRKTFSDMCTYYDVPMYIFGKKEELGHAMGKEVRSSLAVLDAGFSKALVKQMELNGGSEYESE